jgi:hypothetical protein
VGVYKVDGSGAVTIEAPQFVTLDMTAYHPRYYAADFSLYVKDQDIHYQINQKKGARWAIDAQLSTIFMQPSAGFNYFIVPNTLFFTVQVDQAYFNLAQATFTSSANPAGYRVPYLEPKLGLGVYSRSSGTFLRLWLQANVSTKFIWEPGFTPRISQANTVAFEVIVGVEASPLERVRFYLGYRPRMFISRFTAPLSQHIIVPKTLVRLDDHIYLDALSGHSYIFGTRILF